MTTGLSILLFSTNAATKRRGEKAQCGWKERNRRESEKWGRGREFHGETGEDRLFVHGNGESERRRTRCGKCPYIWVSKESMIRCTLSYGDTVIVQSMKEGAKIIASGSGCFV